MSISDQAIREKLTELEWEANHRPRRHALRLFVLAVAGYLYPAGLVLVAFAGVVALLALAPLIASADFRIILLFIAGVIVALTLTAGVLLTFWVKLPAPTGCELRPGEAPQLRQMIEEVARPQGSPPIDHIFIESDINASVTQRPKYGLWGPRINYLAIGLPLMAALTPAQLRVVLAHEFAHLRGRHTSFSAWIYRIFKTWESMAAPFNSAGRLQQVVMGWFVKWYGRRFAISTLAIRRKHEYAADRGSADLHGAAPTAEALLALDWASYRTGKEFYPALLRLANDDPIPPGDFLRRLADFLASPPSEGMVRRWRACERASRTPITSVHPCLGDRLAALDCRSMLDGDADAEITETLPATIDASASSVALLGDSLQRTTAYVNAMWKTEAIGRWRMEHAVARQWTEKLEKPPKEDATTSPADREWERLRLQIERLAPAEAMQQLREFLGRQPDQAAANFTLARLLLNQDDDGPAAAHFEQAMRYGSEFITPSLNILLEYYRQAGRDDDADPIRKRLEEHERAMNVARKERLKVTRRDRFQPHGLGEEEIEKIRRILHRVPQVNAGYLARKDVRLFIDKPGYVLGVRRKATNLLDNRQADKRLTAYLASAIEVPCAVVILSRTSWKIRKRLIQACPTPVFEAND